MGISGSRKGVLRMKSGVAARREWGVLPRNSAVFWAARGCGAAIQRTADMGGCSGRKNF